MKRSFKLLTASLLAVLLAFTLMLSACGENLKPTKITGNDEKNAKKKVENLVESSVDSFLDAYFANANYDPDMEEFFDKVVAKKSKIAEIIIKSAEEAAITGKQLNALLDLDYAEWAEGFMALAMVNNSSYYYDGYDDYDYYSGGMDSSLSMMMALASMDVFKPLKDTGISGQKLGRFIYAFTKNVKSLVLELVDDFVSADEKAEIKSYYDKVLSCATIDQFGLAFGVLVDMGDASWTLFGDMMSAVNFEKLMNGGNAFNMTEKEFKNLVKANIDYELKVLDAVNDNVIDAYVAIAKKTIDVFKNEMYLESAEIKEIKAEIDKGAAIMKKSVKAMKAVYKELKKDDELMSLAYKLVKQGVNNGTEPSAKDANNLMISIGKYVNVAIENGVDKDMLKSAFDLTDSEATTLISEIKKLKSLKYGNTPPSNNKFYQFMANGFQKEGYGSSDYYYLETIYDATGSTVSSYSDYYEYYGIRSAFGSYISTYTYSNIFASTDSRTVYLTGDNFSFKAGADKGYREFYYTKSGINMNLSNSQLSSMISLSESSGSITMTIKTGEYAGYKLVFSRY